MVVNDGGGGVVVREEGYCAVDVENPIEGTCSHLLYKIRQSEYRPSLRLPTESTAVAYVIYAHFAKTRVLGLFRDVARTLVDKR